MSTDYLYLLSISIYMQTSHYHDLNKEDFFNYESQLIESSYGLDYKFILLSHHSSSNCISLACIYRQFLCFNRSLVVSDYSEITQILRISIGPIYCETLISNRNMSARLTIYHVSTTTIVINTNVKSIHSKI